MSGFDISGILGSFGAAASDLFAASADRAKAATDTLNAMLARIAGIRYSFPAAVEASAPAAWACRKARQSAHCIDRSLPATNGAR
jgi:hypothetical protein